MEELLDSIYIQYDVWSRLWVVGFLEIIIHWGLEINLRHEVLPTLWYILILLISGIFMTLTLVRIYDQFYLDSNNKNKLQKLMMFILGPALFITNWFSFFVLIDQLIDNMPYSMIEWCFLLTVSLYNLYSFLLIHYSKSIENKYAYLEPLN